jgi:hypothetical protein
MSRKKSLKLFEYTCRHSYNPYNIIPDGLKIISVGDYQVSFYKFNISEYTREIIDNEIGCNGFYFYSDYKEKINSSWEDVCNNLHIWIDGDKLYKYLQEYIKFTEIKDIKVIAYDGNTYIITFEHDNFIYVIEMMTS